MRKDSDIILSQVVKPLPGKMMKFQVYYSESGLPKEERLYALSAPMIEHHLSCLPSDIDRHFSAKGVTSKVQVNLAKDQQHAEVSLSDGGQSLDLATMFADCISTINGQKKGLCFLVRQVEQ